MTNFIQINLLKICSNLSVFCICTYEKKFLCFAYSSCCLDLYIGIWMACLTGLRLSLFAVRVVIIFDKRIQTWEL